MKINNDGFSYFGKRKYWKNITREERYFCAELFSLIRNNPSKFINWLSTHTKIQLTRDDIKGEWEIGYEVCFYRDFSHAFGKKTIKSKRTFDLCLFSQNKFIVIEAKVQQNFEQKQNIIFLMDKQRIKHIIEQYASMKNIEVSILGLCSSNHRITKMKESPFDDIITWGQINRVYKSPIIARANRLYTK